MPVARTASVLRSTRSSAEPRAAGVARRLGGSADQTPSALSRSGPPPSARGAPPARCARDVTPAPRRRRRGGEPSRAQASTRAQRVERREAPAGLAEDSQDCEINDLASPSPPRREGHVLRPPLLDVILHRRSRERSTPSGRSRCPPRVAPRGRPPRALELQSPALAFPLDRARGRGVRPGSCGRWTGNASWAANASALVVGGFTRAGREGAARTPGPSTTSGWRPPSWSSRQSPPG